MEKIPFEWINNYYKVNAEYNREIEYKGRKGIITEDKGNYIGVQFYDEGKPITHTLHPTWEILYLDTFALPKKVKNPRSKQRYQDYLNNDGYNSFADYLGITK